MKNPKNPDSNSDVDAAMRAVSDGIDFLCFADDSSDSLQDDNAPPQNVLPQAVPFGQSFLMRFAQRELASLARSEFEEDFDISGDGSSL